MRPTLYSLDQAREYFKNGGISIVCRINYLEVEELCFSLADAEAFFNRHQPVGSPVAPNVLRDELAEKIFVRLAATPGNTPYLENAFDAFNAADAFLQEKAERAVRAERAAGNDARQSEGGLNITAGSRTDAGCEIDSDANRARRKESDLAAFADREGFSSWICDERGGQWYSEPNVGRVADGLPENVDRIRALGNAIVPQQIYPILHTIASIENGESIEAAP